MKLSKDKISLIISFYDIRTQYFLSRKSKELQKITNIDINHYKMINFLQNSFKFQHNNMSLFYEHCIVHYSMISEEKIKQILLFYLNEYSMNNEIHIDNIHPFCVDIVNSVKQNIIIHFYSIENNRIINTLLNTNIKEIIYHSVRALRRRKDSDDLEEENEEDYENEDNELNYLLKNVIPYSIKGLYLNLSEFPTCFLTLKKYKKILSKQLSKYPNLENFFIPNIEMELVQDLMNMYIKIPKIKKMYLQLDNDDYIDFSPFKQLTSIKISPVEQEFGFDWKFFFEKINEQLKSLTLEGMIVYVNSELPSFPKLEELNVSRTYWYKDFFCYPSLIKLSFCVNQYVNYVKVLQSHPNLQELTINFGYEYGFEYNKNWSSKEIAENIKIIIQEVNKLTNLKAFSLEKSSSSSDEDEHDVYDAPYKISLPNVETIQLHVGLYDIGQLLHDNPKLSSLTLSGTKVINSKEYYSNINQYKFFKCINIKYLFESKIDESFEPLIDFILKCPNLEILKISRAIPSFIHTIMDNVDKFKYLQQLKLSPYKSGLGINIKDKICKLKKCVLLEELGLVMDWMKEENDIYILIDALKELRFIRELQIGTIDTNWSNFNNIDKIKKLISFYNRDFPIYANQYDEEYDSW